MTVRAVPDEMSPAAVVPPCTLAGLWAVRHGQSTANVAFAAAASGSTVPVPGRDQDVPLSGLGAAQAVALGDWLAGQTPGAGPDLVVCSPYARAPDVGGDGGPPPSSAGHDSTCWSTSGCGTGRWASSSCIPGRAAGSGATGSGPAGADGRVVLPPAGRGGLHRRRGPCRPIHL
ncbi:phosphoglycerate mutase family protein [Streptomyces sp. NPDC047829]|uniref:phosphoglycerate mutase family protein n=1 Tax=Streptomyces sp. NPDC047829 TaxID=3154609 RepID=UPI003401EAAE